ncbi:MAG: hypothetical protein L0Z70_05090 [Chloroflexi bacterium]|nr:hypothetical protein [Chloroflexota bacterium]
MIDRFLNWWEKYNQDTRKRWRWLGQALTIAAIAYIVVLLYLSGFQAREIDWQAYGRAALIALGYYLLSLLIQFFPWARMLSFHHRITGQDIIIYAKTILLRRLPGGVWHWMGRAAMYEGATALSGKTVTQAGILEWITLILLAGGITLSGLELLPAALRLPLAAALIAVAIWLGYAWQPAARSRPARLLESALWSLTYACAWSLGGLIFFAFVRAAGSLDFPLWKAIWVWTMIGAAGQLLFIIPGGSGVRELILAWVMAPYMPLANTILVAVLIRIIFILGDVVWGAVGLALSLLAFKPPIKK